MLDSIVKFVDSGNYFISSEGPTVNLHSVAAFASTAVITTTAKADIDAGDYIIIPTPTTTYFCWMDTTGSVVAPVVAGMTAIRANLASATTAAQVATAVAGAITGVTGLTAVVNSDGDIEVDVDTAGECDPISDFSCGFTLSSVCGGADAGGIIKSATPNSNIVEVLDFSYTSSTDTLIVLCKMKSRVALDSTDPETGYTTTFSYQTITDTNFVLG